MSQSLTTDIRDSREAWLAVVPAFVAGFIVFGVLYGFGVFLEPIAADLQVGRAAVSAVFTIAGLVFYLSGSITGRLGDRFGAKVMIGAGAVAIGAGLSLTAMIDNLWLGYLTYGVGVGIGAACAYIPTLAAVGPWFVKHRNAALGVAAAGTGCGMLVLPPLAAALIGGWGWRRACVILGIGCAVLLALCIAAAKTPPRSGAAASPPIKDVARSGAFVKLYASWVLATAALFVPLAFMPAFALELGVDPMAGSALVSVLGGASIVGRLGIGSIGERIGTVGLFKISVLVMALSYALWLVAGSYLALAAFAAILGLAYGIRIALVPSVLIEIFGTGSPGAILGLFFSASGFAALGPMLAGFVVDLSGSYQWGIALTLVLGLLGFAFIAPLHNGATKKASSA